MKTHWKLHQLLLGAFAVAAFAALAASPAMAGMGVSKHAKLTHKRVHRHARGAAVAAASAAGGVTPAAKPAPKPESSSACPNGFGSLPTAENVGASVETDGTTNKYFFESFETKEVSPGVPGLIKYCVYPDAGVSAPKDVFATYPGWLANKGKKGSTNFGFTRPGGNSTNIPYDGETHQVGTATWPTGQAPTEEQETIVLHINDATECHSLYGEGSPETCFVLPGVPPQAVCDKGGSGVFGYNDIPADFAKGCPLPPSFGFEAHVETSEFGDGVGLAGTGTHITSMTVDFQSYGCSVSGHWNTGESAPCVTASGEPTFNIPASSPDPAGITAHLYEVSGGVVGGKIADSAPNNEPIPFRPSANAEKCTEPPPEAGIEPKSEWFDEATNECHFSISKLMTFSFPATTPVPAGREVVWTVTFNTSNSGYHPLGNGTACRIAGNPGCGYDSLNVGTFTYENAPYAGSDLEVNGVYWNKTAAPLGLALESSPAEEWVKYKPLAQITTAP